MASSFIELERFNFEKDALFQIVMLNKTKFLSKEFDCKECGGNCNRRRKCCQRNGRCQLLLVEDKSIVFWCGIQDSSVRLNPFCEMKNSASLVVRQQIARGPEYSIKISKQEIVCFDKFGETLIAWSRVVDSDEPNSQVRKGGYPDHDIIQILEKKKNETLRNRSRENEKTRGNDEKNEENEMIEAYEVTKLLFSDILLKR